MPRRRKSARHRAALKRKQTRRKKRVRGLMKPRKARGRRKSR
jgi:hypothetical protein